MSIPVEVTTRYATTVDDLPAAWAFVMAHLDSVGPDPSVEIKPFWQASVHDIHSDDHDWPRVFEVVVEGTVREGGEES